MEDEEGEDEEERVNDGGTPRGGVEVRAGKGARGCVVVVHAHEDRARVQPSPQAAEEPRNLTGSTFAWSS